MQQRRMVAVISALDEEVELISQSLHGLTHTHAAGLDIPQGYIQEIGRASCRERV